MRRVVVMSLLLYCPQIWAMDHQDKRFSITSSDGEVIIVPDRSAEQMKVFHPLDKAERCFRSQHDYETIQFLISVLREVEAGTLNASHCVNQYNVKLLNTDTKRMTLSDYSNFHVKQEDSVKHKEPISLMSAIRELGADQLAVIFVSHFVAKKNHEKMFSAMISEEEKSIFENKLNEYRGSTYQSRRKESRDYQDGFAVRNCYSQELVANHSRTLVAQVCDKEKIVFSDQKGSIVKEISLPGAFFSSVAFSGNGSRFACVANFRDDYSMRVDTIKKQFILYIWDTRNWEIIDNVLLDGNAYNLCLNENGTKAVASVVCNDIFSHGGLRSSSFYSLVLNIAVHGTRIAYKIPTESTAKILYWRNDNRFVTSFVNDNDALLYEWVFKKEKNEKLCLTFAQKVFLYGLYERIQFEKLKANRPEAEKKFIAPLMTGSVENFIIKSLPSRLQEWVKWVDSIYQFKLLKY